MQETGWFIFQNYVWNPVLSTVVSFFLGLLFPVVYKKIRKYVQNIRERNANEVTIAGEWNSFFCEEKKLKSEKVTLKQEGRIVTGTILLGTRSYKFSGKFQNLVLMGTYEGKNERGTIVLRYISGQLLSGYCTFVYKHKQVYNSPYVLSLASVHRTEKGTYQFCNGCVGKFDCCCNCSKIDMPILLPNEVEEIGRRTRKRADAFAVKMTNNIYQMRRVDNDETKGCIFFQNNRCSIYEYRPVDCRMFPFDFKEIGGEYWVIYYNEVCNALPTEEDEILMCAHNMRPLLELILPYMSECSDATLSQRLMKQPFVKLFPVSRIRDDNTQ